MIQLNNREKRFIIIGIIIILVSLAYARLIYPTYIKLNALMKEYKEKQGIEGTLEEMESRVEILEAKIDDDMKLLEKVQQAIPYGKDIHKLLLDLEAFIEKHSLRQHAFAPQELEDRESHYILPINIRVSGEFEDIIGVFKDWDSYHRIVNITAAKLNPEEGSTIVGEFVANIFILKAEDCLVEDYEFPGLDGDNGRSDPFAPF